MEQDKKESVIDIKRLVFGVLAKWYIVFVSAILCAALVFGYTYFFVKPKYRSTVQLYVSNYSTKIQLNDDIVGQLLSSANISASRSLVDTYCVILKSRLTIDEVRARTGLDSKYSYEALRSMVNAYSVENNGNDTEIFEISVTSTDPDEAKIIADAVEVVLEEKIRTIIEGSSVKPVDAPIRGKMISPSYRGAALKGALGGFAVGVLVLALYLFLNDALDDESWLTETYGEEIPLLAAIPDAQVHGGYHRYGKYGKYYQSDSYYRPDGKTDNGSEGKA